MIPIRRGDPFPGVPRDDLDAARREATRYYAKAPAQRRQSRFDLGAQLRRFEPAMIEALMRESMDKCAYCESLLSRMSPVINAFRPVAGVEEPSGEYLGDHYWAQAFDWLNYYACCHVCARYKGWRFPVEGPRAAAAAGREDLSAEPKVLLDPGDGDADRHLLFLPDGHVAGRTDRGRRTIEILGLDRDDLVLARREEATRWLAMRRKDLAAAQALLGDGQPYLAMKRQLAAPEGGPGRSRAAASPDAQVDRQNVVAAQQAFNVARERVSTETKTGLQHYRARARYIERVQIRNFMSIESLDLELSASEAEQAPCLAVLGENAVGKSSVLKAIALALGGPRYAGRLAMAPRDLLRHGSDTGSVSVWTSGFKEPTVMHLRRRSTRPQFEQPQSRALVLGYGSSRLLPARGHRPRKGMSHAKIDNLFDSFLPLADAQAFLLAAPKGQFNEAAMRIKQILLLPDDAELIRTRGAAAQVLLEFRPTGRPRAKPERHPLPRLSDGYQSMLALAADLMEIMFGQGYRSMGAAQGLVLIDELGNHLHPRWRMQIVSRLREAFPNVQFVFSTHDPLCLHGLRNGEVVVLQLDAQRRVYALTDLPSIAGLRVDQLLRSEHFGLGSTVEPQTQRDYERYLALKREATPDTAELERLTQRLFAARVLADSPEQRVVLEYMQEQRRQAPATPARNLSAAQLDEGARQALRDLLRKAKGAGR